MKAQIYSLKGKVIDTFSLPKSWDESVNLNLLAQAVHVYEDRSHKGHAKAQTRAEVNRTKKKLFKQKGTGNARHGSRSAPIFVGGGVAHGPKPIKKVLYLPVKMKRKALWGALSLKAKNSEVVILNDISKIKKTKEAQGFLDALKNKRNVTFVLKDNKIMKFLRNMKNVKSKIFSDLNAYDVLETGLLIVDSNIFEIPKKEVKKVTKK